MSQHWHNILHFLPLAALATGETTTSRVVSNIGAAALVAAASAVVATQITQGRLDERLAAQGRDIDRMETTIDQAVQRLHGELRTVRSDLLECQVDIAKHKGAK